MNHVRPAAVAGAFYPDNGPELLAMLDGLMKDQPQDAGPAPKAMIVPHAGLIYSGSIAAKAFARLLPIRDQIKRVILIGPAHRLAFQGIAVPSAMAFNTPLGNIPLDQPSIKRALALPQCRYLDVAHANEHCLEVELPFLQHCLDEFVLVPLLVGQTSPQQVAQLLELLWGGPETLILISSDLSHFKDYESANAFDAGTCQAIEALAYEGLTGEHACGRLPIGGLLEIARRRSYEIDTIAIKNSGDTAGDKSRVVGYGAWAIAAQQPKSDFGAKTDSLLAQHGAYLLRLAAQSIKHGLKTGLPLPVINDPHAPELSRHGACFVTLKKFGQLRGCIGSPEAWRPLIKDVAENAYKAAFRDTRFQQLSPSELEGLELSISVLSPTEPFEFSDEEDFIAKLRPGEDGVILSDQGHRGLFLPIVWDQIPDPAQFLAHLKQKAGLPVDHWSDTMTAQRFITRAVYPDVVGGNDMLWNDIN